MPPVPPVPLKSQIPIRTWADWDDATLGFVEIDLVGHDGGNPRLEHCFGNDLPPQASWAIVEKR